MTSTRSDDAVSDAVLTAYLDNELEPDARKEIERLLSADPRLRNRLAVLASGASGIRPAFDQVLERAPVERLEALLGSATADPSISPVVRGRHHAHPTLMALAASLLLVIGGSAGFIVGQAPPAFVARLFAWDEWQESVARQVSLYNRASLAAIRVDQAEQQARLDHLAEVLGLHLSLDTVALPDLALKRVERLQIDGRPLAQLLYASDDLGPVALCILRESDEGTERERRQVAGMTLVYWSAGAHGFLLVGKAPLEEMQKLAETAARHISG